MYPFNRFSESAKRVLSLAQAEAVRSHHSYIGTEHLLLGILADGNCVAARAMHQVGVDLPAAHTVLDRRLAKGEAAEVKEIVPTARVKRVIEAAFEAARRSNSPIVGTDHMLLGLMTEKEGVAAQTLAELGVSQDKIRIELERAAAANPERATNVEGSQPSPERTPKHVSLKVSTSEGEVQVLLMFPESVGEERCQAIAARVAAAVKET